MNAFQPSFQEKLQQLVDSLDGSAIVVMYINNFAYYAESKQVEGLLYEEFADIYTSMNLVLVNGMFPPPDTSIEFTIE